MQGTQSYLMIIAYAFLFIGLLISGFGWSLFKIRALTNKPAWDGIGGKLMKLGITIAVIGAILTAVALFMLRKG
ncbi:hypothetical protein ACYATP_08515 [Lactobacillaceae bacterium Melli_B4]